MNVGEKALFRRADDGEPWKGHGLYEGCARTD